MKRDFAPKKSRAPASVEAVDAPVNVPQEMASNEVTALEAAPMELEPPTNPEPAEAATDQVPEKKIFLWLESGMSRHHLTHSLTNGVTSSFDSMRGPSLGVRAGFSVDELGFEAAYESQPGEVESAANATVEGGTYNWNTLRGAISWRGLGQGFKVKVGAEQHTSPFLYPDSSVGRVYVRRVHVNYASVGLGWETRLSEKNRLEAKAAYLQALKGDTLDRSQLDLSGQVSGNVGLDWVHELGTAFRIGLGWRSEFQRYRFQYRATSATSTVNGEQSLSSHSLGIKFGWEY